MSAMLVGGARMVPVWEMIVWLWCGYDYEWIVVICWWMVDGAKGA